MTNIVPVELHVRRASDRAHLEPVARELTRLGIEAELTGRPDTGRGTSAAGCDPLAELRPGPIPCRLRVLVEDPHDPVAPPPSSDAESLVVLWTSAAAPEETLRDVSPLLEQAALVLVPGDAHARALAPRVCASVEAVGLPALDPWSSSVRGAVRERLAVSERTRLWLYVPSSRPGSPALWFGDELARLCEDGAVVAVHTDDWPAAWREQHRELASRCAGMMLVDAHAIPELLRAADAVIADAGATGFAAAALGLAVVPLDGGVPASEPGSAARARALAELRAALHAPRGAARSDLLQTPGMAAARAARAIADRCAAHTRRGGDAPDALPGRQSEPRGDWREAIEARIAFGDLDGARAELAARLQSEPSAAVARMLASVQRMRREFADAESSAARAETWARSELARVLCERARIEIECGRFEPARELFARAMELAPALADAPLGLGSLALHGGEGPRAEQHFRAALELDKTAPAWTGLGLALAAQGRSRDALPALQAALDLDPECQAALYGLVQAAIQSGELGTAASRLEIYVAQHPGNLGFAFALAALALERGQLAQARRLADQIELFDPAYAGLAELREKLRAAG